MTLMADEEGLKQVKDNPLTAWGVDSRVIIPAPRSVSEATGVKHMLYKRSTLASIKVEEDCCCMMGNWVLKTDSSSEPATAQRGRGLSVA
jgi:hypothetical protein